MDNATINRRELLITLEYLLKETSETNPAKQLDICRYAKDKYNLKFDEDNPKGNEIRRDRIKEALEFLYEYINEDSNSYFVINKTSKGKYYVTYKQEHLDNISKIISAIKNDKTTINDENLISYLLDLTVSKDKRVSIISSSIANKKIGQSSAKKIDIINRAINEKKILCIIENAKVNEYLAYKIMEFNNQLYAILIEVRTGNLKTLRIQDIRLPSTNYLLDDIDNKRSIDSLFKRSEMNRNLNYSSIEEYVKDMIKPNTEHTPVHVSFYFDASDTVDVVLSFENFFAKKMNVEFSKQFRVLDINNDEVYSIVNVLPCKINENPIYGILNIHTNPHIISSWLASSPNIVNKVKVVSPSIINQELARYFDTLNKEFSKYL